MNLLVTYLRGSGRRLLAIALSTLMFLVVPAFSQATALMAHAVSPNQTGIKPMSQDTKNTLKRLQDKAEDLGDRAERPIGDTGLKNIKKLGENIPETAALKLEQNKAIRQSSNPSVKDLDRAQQKVERHWER